MVWSAVLLILVLVLGRGEAYSQLVCDEYSARQLAAGDFPEDMWSLRGFFVDPARQTRVFLRILLNEKTVPYHECFLQHEGGPGAFGGLLG